MNESARVLKHASRAVSDQQPMSAYNTPAKESIDSEYTVHIEPPEQGGGRYARCTGCEREIIPVGRFGELTHASDCAHSEGEH
jgi:hypothetical protein